MSIRLSKSDLKFSTVAIAGLDINTFEVGSGEPVLLLHGSGPGASAWSNFAPNVAPLAEHFRVVGMDFPGWGDSSAVPPGDTDQVANVLGVLDTLGIARVALIGNSLGGATALKVAATAPERISAVVAMGVHSGRAPMMSPAGPSEGIRALVGAYRDPSLAGMRRLVEAMAFSPDLAGDELVRSRSEDALAHPEHLANFLVSFQQGRFLRPPAHPDDYAKIVAPTMLIHGRDDRVLPYEHSLALLPLFSDARLLLLNRCGHWAQLEHAAEFNREVISFIHAALRDRF